MSITPATPQNPNTPQSDAHPILSNPEQAKPGNELGVDQVSISKAFAKGDQSDSR